MGSPACGGGDLDRRQHQAALAAPDQFQINFRRQLGVQQGAVLAAGREVDAETFAQFVQGITRAGDFALGDFDRVHGAGQPNGARPTRFNSALMNLMSKLALWITSGASPRNSKEFLDHMAEQRLSARNSADRP